MKKFSTKNIIYTPNIIITALLVYIFLILKKSIKVFRQKNYENFLNIITLYK